MPAEAGANMMCCSGLISWIELIIADEVPTDHTQTNWTWAS